VFVEFFLVGLWIAVVAVHDRLLFPVSHRGAFRNRGFTCGDLISFRDLREHARYRCTKANCNLDELRLHVGVAFLFSSPQAT
jgi:hypothetical protein